eukprot:scaffold99230_cov35-Tisochrysis_lutea.AAC.2
MPDQESDESDEISNQANSPPNPSAGGMCSRRPLADVRIISSRRRIALSSTTCRLRASSLCGLARPSDATCWAQLVQCGTAPPISLCNIPKSELVSGGSTVMGIDQRSHTTRSCNTRCGGNGVWLSGQSHACSLTLVLGHLS